MIMMLVSYLATKRDYMVCSLDWNYRAFTNASVARARSLVILRANKKLAHPPAAELASKATANMTQLPQGYNLLRLPCF